VVAISLPPLLTRPQEVASAIRAVNEDGASDVTLITVFMQAQGLPPELEGIPSYRFPEDAARALARAARYGSWRAQPEGIIPEFPDVRRDEAAALIDRSLQDGPRWLRPDEVAELLSFYALPLAEWRMAGGPEQAAELSAELGGPVAVKAVAPDLIHKTEAGAVALDLKGRDEVRAAAEEMERRMSAIGHAPTGFMVQRMVEGGVEMLIGVVHDPSFGPVLACGAGGTAVELMRDVSVRITPLTDLDADEMLRELKTFPLLQGYRGSAPADLAAISDVILRLSTLVEDHRQIAETDLNPVMALPDGAVIVDARVRVEPAPPPPPLSARRPG
jgi:acetate---CoA ligase (ADP-forming)